MKMHLEYCPDLNLQQRYRFEAYDLEVIEHIESEIADIVDEINKLKLLNLTLGGVEETYQAVNIEGDNKFNRNNTRLSFILIDEYFRHTLKHLPIKVGVKYKCRSYCNVERNRIKSIPFYISYTL